MKNFQNRRVVLCIGATLMAMVLMGCGGKSEEVTTTPASTSNPTANQPTSNQIPPEVKARMDQTQNEMKSRADAQGKAMMQSMQNQKAGN